jgi:hypothetical protein
MRDGSLVVANVLPNTLEDRSVSAPETIPVFNSRRVIFPHICSSASALFIAI